MATIDNPLAAANGHADIDPDETIKQALHERIDGLESRRAELQQQLDEITPSLHRYEKSLRAIEGRPMNNARPRTIVEAPDGEPEGEPVVRRGPGRPRRSPGVAEAAIQEIEATVRRLAAEADDFTQVQVRGITGHSSGKMALAFEALRQREVIRLVRREGNVKVYRLTQRALSDAARAETP